MGRHRLNGRRQKELILPQFWRAEVCRQGVSRVTLCPQAPGDSPCLSQLLVLQAILAVPWLVAASPQSLLTLS